MNEKGPQFSDNNTEDDKIAIIFKSPKVIKLNEILNSVTQEPTVDKLHKLESAWLKVLSVVEKNFDNFNHLDQDQLLGALNSLYEQTQAAFDEYKNLDTGIDYSNGIDPLSQTQDTVAQIVNGYMLEKRPEYFQDVTQENQDDTK